MINTMPAVNNPKPSKDFFVNFSFKTRLENSIVNKIASLLIEFTAIGLTPSIFNA